MMTTANLIFFSVGTLCALLSGAFLFKWGMEKNTYLWKNARLLYVIIGCFELYMGIVYGSVLFGFVRVNQYGPYIRPVAFISYLAPVLIALVNRRQQGKPL